MTRNKPAGTTLAVICAVLVVLAIAVLSAKGAVPPPSADAILAMQQQATVDPASSSPPTDEPCLSEQTPHEAQVIQIKKAWVESWAVGERQDRPDGPSDEANGGPDLFDDAPPDRGHNSAEGRRDQPERTKVLIFRDDRCDENVDCLPGEQDPSLPGLRSENRRPDQRERGPWAEVNLLLKSFNDLIDFYDEQGRWGDKERTLKERIGICRKLAELRMLAQTDGPGAAMQEFYRSVGRRDRAIELDLHNIEQQLDRLEQESAALDAEIARLASRSELLEHKRSELKDRLEQRAIELSLLHQQMEEEQADCDDEGDDEDSPDHAGDAVLSRHIETVDRAITDRGMDTPRRTRLERRLARILEMLDSSMSSPRDLQVKAWRWLQDLSARIDACIRRVNSRPDQSLVSRIVGPPESLDQ